MRAAIALILLLALSGCDSSISSGAVMDVGEAKANLICQDTAINVKDSGDLRSCYDEKNIKMILENNGVALEGIKVKYGSRGLLLNTALTEGRVAVENIAHDGDFDGKLSLTPIVDVDGNTYICRIGTSEVTLKRC